MTPFRDRDPLAPPRWRERASGIVAPPGACFMAPLGIGIGISPVLLGRGGTIYYVDATAGNDGNTGLSPADAWQTIAKVNGFAFDFGDQVLFKRGETWTGTRLTVPSDGLTFSDYGAGAKPVIDGNNVVNCVSPNGKHNLAFHNIEVTQGLNFGFEFNNVHGIALYDCEAHDCGNDNVLFINGAYDCFVRNLVSYDAYERVAGPRISCLEIADGAHDIVVETAELYGSAHAGVTIHSHPATEFPYNLTLRDINSHDNDLFGIVLSQDNAVLSVADANIRLTDCAFLDNAGGAGTGGQIWITKTGDPYPTGIILDRCEAIGVADRPLYMAGKAEFYHCVFVSQYSTQLDTSTHAVFYNCTLYRNAALVFDTINNCDDITIRNCILYANGNDQINIRLGTTNVTLDYNVWYNAAFNLNTTALMGWLGAYKTFPNWKADSGQDAHSPTPADPLFVDPANDDFTLQLGSPAIDAGVVIPGVTDGYLGAAPDCGYAERA